MTIVLATDCTNCGAKNDVEKGQWQWVSDDSHSERCQPDERQWWWLSNYHGIYGRFCPNCFSDVAHDSYGRPIHPEQFQAVLDAQNHKRAIRRLKGNR